MLFVEMEFAKLANSVTGEPTVLSTVNVFLDTNHKPRPPMVVCPRLEFAEIKSVMLENSAIL